MPFDSALVACQISHHKPVVFTDFPPNFGAGVKKNNKMLEEIMRVPLETMDWSLFINHKIASNHKQWRKIHPQIEE